MVVQKMQPPTCSGIRVRSVADCHILFYAVTLGILPLISRRLTIEERRAIRSGCIFVWEERTPTIEAVNDGLERWTDSRRWGASRLTKDFLLYQEKLPEVNDPQLQAAMFHSRLVKQTYSVYVEKPDGRRKWHLVAYSSPETGHQLATVDDIPDLAALRYHIPEGKYQAARFSKTRARPDVEVEDAPSGGTLIEFPASGSSPGSSSPDPHTLSTSHPPSQSYPPRSNTGHIVAPSPIPPPSIFSLPSAETWLPKLVSTLPRPDPDWVLENYVAVSPDASRTQNRGLLGHESSGKNMAPLLYTRRSPYRPRHPLDNDALRALDNTTMP